MLPLQIMDPCPFFMEVHILWHIWDMDPPYNMDLVSIYIGLCIVYSTCRKLTPIDFGSVSIFYDRDSYSIGNMDPGSIFHRVHILYD